MPSRFGGAGGGDVFFIPPEFYGVAGLGQSMQQLGQTLEGQRARREQERLQGEALGIRQGELEIKRAQETRATRSENLRQYAAIGELLGLDKPQIKQLMGQVLPELSGLDVVRSPEDIEQRMVTEGLSLVNDVEAGGWDNPAMSDAVRAATARFLTDDPLFSTTMRLTEEAVKTEEILNATRLYQQVQQENADAALEPFYAQEAPWLSGLGTLGLSLWGDTLNLEKAEVSVQLMQEQILQVQQAVRASQAAAALDMAQTGAIGRQADPVLNAIRMQQAELLVGQVGSTVSPSTLAAFVDDPDSEEISDVDREILTEAGITVQGRLDDAARLKLETMNNEQASSLRILNQMLTVMNATENPPDEMVDSVNDMFNNWVGQMYPGALTEVPNKWWERGQTHLEFNWEAITNPLVTSLIKKGVNVPLPSDSTETSAIPSVTGPESDEEIVASAVVFPDAYVRERVVQFLQAHPSPNFRDALASLEAMAIPPGPERPHQEALRLQMIKHLQRR